MPHGRACAMNRSQAFEYNPHLETVREAWRKNLEVPFYGITHDGKRKEGLYQLRDEGAPTKMMVEAARSVLKSLSPSEKTDTVHDLDSETWRKWSNPEFVLHKCGVRLEDLEEPKTEAIISLLKQSLSPGGFAKVRGAMRQMVIGPVFIGAEPNTIDEGPDKGLTLCANEGQLGLQLMQSLPPKLQQAAQIYPTMKDPAMQEGRWNRADQRHMAGAFQDNRVIPYEGVVVTDMPEEQQILVMAIVHEFLALWPSESLRRRLKQILKHLAETHFCWIGGFGPDDSFYYRIQSPVALFEVEHHSGVFLTNEEPAKYHIHTIQRLPNGNDYGRRLRELLRPQ
ncbi:hypothetical protein BDP81DRAFT_457948 [Colletotrichum phormii]|uniref:Uncharacterized protein n=1 Tax=Colletotrichum phormii TaxID=359342 RepID=A0AAJ0A072_9PEZI|nr:uncharacterized protein BDP81DRAFT_457948 [Colletotrichum phormii]KAK1641025.1 hypothetical protein BDP81DRAFT_457948 [Colletotrichum phormii]